MRRLLIPFLMITLMAAGQSVVYADAGTYSKVYVPLPYILATHPGITDGYAALSAIAVDRGVFSYVLYHLPHPNEREPPVISEELKAKYDYDRYSDKRFEPLMKDYTIWAMEAGYLSVSGKANHLLPAKWADIASLFAVLDIRPVEVEDYSMYDNGWGFVTESEKAAIGLFYSAFGRGIDSKSLEKKSFTLTVADLIYLAYTRTDTAQILIDTDEMRVLTGYNFYSAPEARLNNGMILAVCFPYFLNNKNETEIYDLKIWAKKEGFVNYEN